MLAVQEPYHARLFYIACLAGQYALFPLLFEPKGNLLRH